MYETDFFCHSEDCYLLAVCSLYSFSLDFMDGRNEITSLKCTGLDFGYHWLCNDGIIEKLIGHLVFLTLVGFAEGMEYFLPGSILNSAYLPREETVCFSKGLGLFFL